MLVEAPVFVIVSSSIGKEQSHNESSLEDIVKSSLASTIAENKIRTIK